MYYNILTCLKFYTKLCYCGVYPIVAVKSIMKSNLWEGISVWEGGEIPVPPLCMKPLGGVGVMYMYLDVTEGGELALCQCLYNHQWGHEVVLLNVVEHLRDLSLALLS